MAQLQRMDASLDTFSTKLYQLNVHVDHIARRQVAMGGFAIEPTPSPPHPIASDSDAKDDNDDDVMTMMLQMMMKMLALSIRCLLHTLPFVTRDKKREQFWI